MTKPSIHLNGTAAADLTQGYADAHAAVQDAITKVCAACPNGRDYYPQGQPAMQAAQDEHWARLRLLKQVAAELEELGMHCADFVK